MLRQRNEIVDGIATRLYGDGSHALAYSMLLSIDRCECDGESVRIGTVGEFGCVRRDGTVTDGESLQVCMDVYMFEAYISAKT